MNLTIKLIQCLNLQDRFETSKKIFKAAEPKLKSNSNFKIIYDQLRVHYAIHEIQTTEPKEILKAIKEIKSIIEPYLNKPCNLNNKDYFMKLNEYIENVEDYY